MTDRVQIRKLSTGVPGLDSVLGGGLPEFSFNLIAGGPGCGKTTLAHQFVFANASEERKALYFTIFGEPPVKMLRYQQQYSFFDSAKIDRAVRFVHLGKELVEGGLAMVLERVTRELETDEARTVVVDSFRSLARSVDPQGRATDPLNLERFVQLLALNLTSYQATTFLVGEYADDQTDSNPVFTVADGIIWLSQTVIRNSSVRQLQIVKMRGQSVVPGLHVFKLSDDGVGVYPRLGMTEAPRDAPSPPAARSVDVKRTGIRGLDEMLGGGIPAGYSMLVAGPSGSGKTMLATQFILEGIRCDERAVIAIFETRPDEYLRTSSRGKELTQHIAEKRVALAYIRPLDLSVDEALEDVREQVRRLGAKRVVIDSLSGFELALSPAFRDDFRESLYRMVGSLTNLGVTVVLTVDVTDSFTELRLSPHGVSFLSDGIILQRYIEIGGHLRRAMAVIKLRGTSHKNELREYEISGTGLDVGEVLTGYRGILTGVPIEAAVSRKAPAKPVARRSPKGKKRRR